MLGNARVSGSWGLFNPLFFCYASMAMFPKTGNPHNHACTKNTVTCVPGFKTPTATTNPRSSATRATRFASIGTPCLSLLSWKSALGRRKKVYVQWSTCLATFHPIGVALWVRWTVPPNRWFWARCRWVHSLLAEWEVRHLIYKPGLIMLSFKGHIILS